MTKTSDLSFSPGQQLKSEVLVADPLQLRSNLEFTPQKPKSSDTLDLESTHRCSSFAQSMRSRDGEDAEMQGGAERGQLDL